MKALSYFTLFSLLVACAEKEDEQTETAAEDEQSVDTEDADTETDDEADDETDTSDETDTVEETSVCAESYGFCGSIMMPSDMTGTPRSMAISLYDTLNPAGPPNVTVIEIDAPDVAAGEPFELEFSPLIATGEYYVWIFLYMEGGGEWAPEAGIDYFGHTDSTLVFDGQPVIFPDIALSMAE